MIASEREKLLKRESEYLSIGITENGVPYMSIGIPWVATAHAYNMRTPNVYISPDDLQDEEVMSLIGRFKVIGCYIWTSLTDYGFLSRFKELQDINIKNGDAVRDLEFLSELHECRMLYLRNAKLKDLDVIVKVKKNSKTSFGAFRCICLNNCEVEDLSIFETEKVHFSEFLVWKPKGSNERERWNVVSAGTRRYVEFDE